MKPIMKMCTRVAFFLQLFVLNHVQADVLSTSDVKATLKNTIFVGEANFHSSGKGCVQFRGIRYGNPPVGDKRFQKSTMFDYVGGTVIAKTYGNVCHQRRDNNSHITLSDTMNEDCLFLNIIVPLSGYAETSTVDSVSDLGMKKAVYIFIHGGGFLQGSSNLFDPEEFTEHGDFIVVTINYRLGIFGFLTTDDDVMPANLGLWDQQLAIKWVKENIEAFGGDNSRITVGGQLAGSISAILQSFYDGNSDLFQNTIAQSGSPMAFNVISEKGLPTTLAIAAMARCRLKSNQSEEWPEEILQCLNGKSPMDLVNIQSPGKPFGPVLDNDFITMETFELCPQAIRRFSIPDSISPAFANKNLLIGFNSQDGAIAIDYLSTSTIVVDALPTPMSTDETMRKLNYPEVLQFYLRQIVKQNLGAANIRTLANSIVHRYLEEAKPTDDVFSPRVDVVKLATDMYFANPAMDTALLHSMAKPCSSCNKANGKTFMYAFHDLTSIDKVRHTLPVVTAFTLTAWSNFIKTGDPNSEDIEKWEEFTNQSKLYCDLTDDPTHVMENLFTRRQFWKEYIPFWQEQLDRVQKRSLGSLLKSGDEE